MCRWKRLRFGLAGERSLLLVGRQLVFPPLHNFKNGEFEGSCTGTVS